uniref:CUB domain-containing protein n=1 Tax=Branchiostoma floridae TaxID=7739 RepID=C3Y911_BRAFL|eukprot:XP_002607057.1 hypothetical protein BRAFLDRAFT_68161 [Branchiostoma floridae]
MGESLRIRRWQWGFYCVVAMLTVLPPMTHGDRYQTFSMECGGTVELGDTEAGYVSYSYDPGQDCTVTFTGASGKKFLLHFVTLDMGPDDSCDDQELRIYDGEQASGDLLASVCGSEQEGLDVTTSTNFVTLRLTSGDSASGDLRIKYTMFYDSAAEGEDVSDSAEAEPEGEPESEPEAEPESEPEPESEWIPELGMTMWALTGIIIGTVAFLIFTGVAAYFAVKLMAENTVRSQRVAAVLDDKNTWSSILHSNRYDADHRDLDLHPDRPWSIPWTSGQMSRSTGTPQPHHQRDYITESDTKGPAPYMVWTPGDKGKAIRGEHGGLYQNVIPILKFNRGTARNRLKGLKNLYQDSQMFEEKVYRRDIMGNSLRQAILGNSKRGVGFGGGFWSSAAPDGTIQVQLRDLMGNVLRRVHKVTDENRNSGKRSGDGWGDVKIRHYKPLKDWNKTGKYISSRLNHLGVTPSVVKSTHLRHRLYLIQELQRVSAMDQKVAYVARDGAGVTSNKDQENLKKVGIEGDESGQTRFFIGRKLLSEDSQADDHQEDDKQRGVTSEESKEKGRRDIVGHSFLRDSANTYSFWKPKKQRGQMVKPSSRLDTLVRGLMKHSFRQFHTESKGIEQTVDSAIRKVKVLKSPNTLFGLSKVQAGKSLPPEAIRAMNVLALGQRNGQLKRGSGQAGPIEITDKELVNKTKQSLFETLNLTEDGTPSYGLTKAVAYPVENLHKENTQENNEHDNFDVNQYSRMTENSNANGLVAKSLSAETKVQQRDVMGSSFRKVMTSGKRSIEERREDPHANDDVKTTDKVATAGHRPRQETTSSPHPVGVASSAVINHRIKRSEIGFERLSIYKDFEESSEVKHTTKKKLVKNRSLGIKSPSHGKQPTIAEDDGRNPPRSASRGLLSIKRHSLGPSVEKYSFQKKDLLGDSLRRIMGKKDGYSYSSEKLDTVRQGYATIPKLKATANILGKAFFKRPTNDMAVRNDKMAPFSTTQAIIQHHNNTSENANQQAITDNLANNSNEERKPTTAVLGRSSGVGVDTLKTKSYEEKSYESARADNLQFKHRRIRRNVDGWTDSLARGQDVKSLLDRRMVEYLLRSTRHPEESHKDPRGRLAGDETVLTLSTNDTKVHVVKNSLEEITPRDIMGNIFRGRRSDENGLDQQHVNAAYLMATSSRRSQRHDMDKLLPDLNTRLRTKGSWKHPSSFRDPNVDIKEPKYRGLQTGENGVYVGQAVAFPEELNSSPTTNWSSRNRQETSTMGVRAFDKIRKPSNIAGNAFKNVIIQLESIFNEPVLDVSNTVGTPQDSSDKSYRHDLREKISEGRPGSTGLLREDNTWPSLWYLDARHGGAKQLMKPTTDQTTPNTDRMMSSQYGVAKAAPFDDVPGLTTVLTLHGHHLRQ